MIFLVMYPQIFFLQSHGFVFFCFLIFLKIDLVGSGGCLWFSQGSRIRFLRSLSPPRIYFPSPKSESSDFDFLKLNINSICASSIRSHDSYIVNQQCQFINYIAFLIISAFKLLNPINTELNLLLTKSLIIHYSLYFCFFYLTINIINMINSQSSLNYTHLGYKNLNKSESMFNIIDLIDANLVVRKAAEEIHGTMSKNPSEYLDWLFGELEKRNSVGQVQIIYVIIDGIFHSCPLNEFFFNAVLKIIMLFYSEPMAQIRSQIINIIYKYLKKAEVLILNVVFVSTMKSQLQSDHKSQPRILELLTVIFTVLRQRNVYLQALSQINLNYFQTLNLSEEIKPIYCIFMVELMRIEKSCPIDIIHKIFMINPLPVCSFLQEDFLRSATWFENKKVLEMVFTFMIGEQWWNADVQCMMSVMSVFKSSLKSYLSSGHSLASNSLDLFPEYSMERLIGWSLSTCSFVYSRYPVNESCGIRHKIFKILSVFLTKRNYEMIGKQIIHLEELIKEGKSDRNQRMFIYEFFSHKYQEIKDKINTQAIAIRAIQDITNQQYQNNQFLYEYLLRFNYILKDQQISSFIQSKLQQMNFSQLIKSIKLCNHLLLPEFLCEALVILFDQFVSEQKVQILNTITKSMGSTTTINIQTLLHLINSDYHNSQLCLQIAYLNCLSTSIKHSCYDCDIFLQIWQFMKQLNMIDKVLLEYEFQLFFFFSKNYNTYYSNKIQFIGKQLWKIMKGVFANINNLYYKYILIELIEGSNTVILQDMIEYLMGSMEPDSLDILQIISIKSPRAIKNPELLLERLRESPLYFRFYQRLRVSKKYRQIKEIPSDIMEIKWYVSSYIHYHELTIQPYSPIESLDEDDLKIIQEIQNLSLSDTIIRQCVNRMSKMEENKHHWIMELTNTSLKSLWKEDFKAHSITSILRKFKNITRQLQTH